MDENDILFVTTSDDERNARPTSSDHRTGGGSMVRTPFSAKRPRHIVIQSGASREPVIVRQVPAEPIMAPERRQFGNLTASEAVEAVSQVIAMLQPLPVAPLATGRSEDDIANLTLYSAALALHAKRDEQLRTLGSLLSKLMS